jgi:hypothetical protein
MLGSITTLGERGRHRRWRVTYSWFLFGAVVGGAALGAVAAAISGLVDPIPAPARLALGGIGAAAIVCAIVRAQSPPSTGRQVDHRWLDKYRASVVGGGFGFQLGTGVMTRIWSYAVYLFLVLALLGAPWWALLAAGTAYGGTRGLAAFPGRWVRDVRDLARITVVLERWDGFTQRASRLVDCGAAVVAVVVALGAAL